jgi:hypothetical protein
MISEANSDLIEEVLVEAGTNMSIGCPGLTRNTFVVQLEWVCTGQCGDSRTSAASAEATHGLLKYVKDKGTTVFKSKGRVMLEDEENFSLSFSPVDSRDRGKYSCLINNQAKPDAVIKLKVLGELRFWLEARVA